MLYKLTLLCGMRPAPSMVQDGVPEPESGCNIEALRSAVDHWSAIQDSQKLQNLTVSASDIHCFGEPLLCSVCLHTCV